MEKLPNSIGSNFSKTKNIHKPVGRVHFVVFEKLTSALQFLFHIVKKNYLITCLSYTSDIFC